MLSQIIAARVAAFGLAVLASTSLAAVQASRDDAPPILIDVAGPTGAATGEPSWLLATTPIETDLNRLASLDRTDDPAAAVLSVALRSNVRVDLTGFRRVPVNATSFAWSAHVADVPGSYAIIANRGDAVRGIFGVPGTGLFDLHSDGDGRHIVRQLDSNHPIGCLTCENGECADGDIHGIGGLSSAVVVTSEGEKSVTEIANTVFCRNTPQHVKGPWTDLGGNSIYAVGDLNCDGSIDGGDLIALLAEWGPCETLNDCPADFNVDGTVDGADLAQLLAIWGASTP